MIKRALAAFSFAFACTPAFATGEIVCSNGKGVTVDLLVGHLDGLFVSRVLVSVDDKYWSSTPESMPGLPISVGQAFEDDRQILFDIMDDNMGQVIGRLRVFKATEGDKSVSGGVFSLKDEGAFVVDCSDPE